jgi:hypothetical protein
MRQSSPQDAERCSHAPHATGLGRPLIPPILSISLVKIARKHYRWGAEKKSRKSAIFLAYTDLGEV